ncbi:unnamed protein product, partial [Rotaria sp. Silwood2]
MSQNNAHLNEIWTKLEKAIVQMFELSFMTIKGYMDLYNAIGKYVASSEYNEMILKASPSELQKKAEVAKNENEVDDDDQINTNHPSAQIYFKLKKTLKENLDNIVKGGSHFTGEDFLRFYCKAWEIYQFTSRIVNSLLKFINDNWIRQQGEAGVKRVYNIYIMALKVWQDMFFKQANHSLTRTCLNLIKDERDGKNINYSLIHEAIQSY